MTSSRSIACILGVMLGLGILLFAHPPLVYANSCAPDFDIITSNSYGPTFGGRVVSVQPLKENAIPALAGTTEYEIGFDILFAVRGVSGSAVTVISFQEDPGLDEPFEEGEYYLVFADRDPKSGRLYTHMNSCTLTGTFKSEGGMGILGLMFPPDAPEWDLIFCHYPGAVCRLRELPTTGQISSAEPVYLFAGAALLLIGLGIRRKHWGLKK